MLREYQTRAFEATLDSLRRGKNPVCAVATGGGKSLIAAALVDRFRSRGGYTLMVTHNRTLVTQNLNALKRYSNDVGVGVYSAGLNSSVVGESATYGTIQTVYRNMDKLPQDISAIIVDEAHAVAHKTSSSKMYNALMEKFPNARRIGLSATPYRLDRGVIYDGEGAHFDDLAVEITVLELIELGYLSPLIGLKAADKLDLDGVKITNGDFDTKQVDERITENWLRCVIDKISFLASDRKAILLFAPTVRTAALASQIATEKGISAEYVHGGDDERDDRLKRWEAGEFKLMANCQILTTGYDRPDIDCIVDCAPTESLGKHVQKLGRGTRIADGKRDCLIIDVSGNLERLGGICVGMKELYEEAGKSMKLTSAEPAPKKEKRKVRTANELTELDPMLANPKGFRARVLAINFIVINAKQRPGKRLLMVSYECVTGGGLIVAASTFLCVEYDGFALYQASQWFARRGEDSFPRRAEAARSFCWGLPVPREVTIKKNGKHLNIISEHF